MPSSNTPCKNPKLCGVQSHRPGTVPACAASPGASAEKNRKLSASAPKLSTTPESLYGKGDPDKYAREVALQQAEERAREDAWLEAQGKSPAPEDVVKLKVQADYAENKLWHGGGSDPEKFAREVANYEKVLKLAMEPEIIELAKKHNAGDSDVRILAADLTDLGYFTTEGRGQASQAIQLAGWSTDLSKQKTVMLKRIKLAANDPQMRELSDQWKIADGMYDDLGAQTALRSMGARLIEMGLPMRYSGMISVEVNRRIQQIHEDYLHDAMRREKTNIKPDWIPYTIKGARERS